MPLWTTFTLYRQVSQCCFPSNFWEGIGIDAIKRNHAQDAVCLSALPDLPKPKTKAWQRKMLQGSFSKMLRGCISTRGTARPRADVPSFGGETLGGLGDFLHNCNNSFHPSTLIPQRHSGHRSRFQFEIGATSVHPFTANLVCDCMLKCFSSLPYTHTSSSYSCIAFLYRYSAVLRGVASRDVFPRPSRQTRLPRSL
jgi:hypothetical protein